MLRVVFDTRAGELVVERRVARLLGEAEAGEVRHHGADALRRERLRHVPPEEAPGRVAVHEERDGRAWRGAAGLHHVEPEAVHLEEVALERDEPGDALRQRGRGQARGPAHAAGSQVMARGEMPATSTLVPPR